VANIYKVKGFNVGGGHAEITLVEIAKKISDR
jgi:hypothetical protein